MINTFKLKEKSKQFRSIFIFLFFLILLLIAYANRLPYGFHNNLCCQITITHAFWVHYSCLIYNYIDTPWISFEKSIISTMQVMNLNNAETEWLARHLGHSVRIHKDFYRLQTPAIELGRVARLLIAVDNGKTLENISEDQEGVYVF